MSFYKIMRKYGDNYIKGYKEACKATNTPCHHPRYAHDGMRCLVCGNSKYTPPGRVI